MTPTTKALLEVIGNAGSVVSQTGDGQDNHVVEAVNEETGERFMVRSEDINEAAIELAVAVGIALEDG